MATEASPKIELQERDAEILRGLFDSRLMTLAHAAALHFDGRQEAAKKRIQKLKAAGLIGERKRKVYEPSVLFLTREGFSLLTDRGLLSDAPQMTWSSLQKRLQVSDLTLRHELEVMDAKASLATALRHTTAFQRLEFSTWPVLFQFAASPTPGVEFIVKPDGFVRIEEHDDDERFEHTFFIEVDRSTETLDTLVQKALGYLDYYQRGGLAVRAGRPRSEYKEFPFRVLMIFKSEERRNNTAERLLAAHRPIFTQVWMTTMKEFLAEPLAAIWTRPTDVRSAITSAGLTTDPYAERDVYRRQSERDRLIAKHLTKLRIFDSDPEQ
jgi:hypothetical protein